MPRHLHFLVQTRRRNRWVRWSRTTFSFWIPIRFTKTSCLLFLQIVQKSLRLCHALPQLKKYLLLQLKYWSLLRLRSSSSSSLLSMHLYLHSSTSLHLLSLLLWLFHLLSRPSHHPRLMESKTLRPSLSLPCTFYTYQPWRCMILRRRLKPFKSSRRTVLEKRFV